MSHTAARPSQHAFEQVLQCVVIPNALVVIVRLAQQNALAQLLQVVSHEGRNSRDHSVPTHHHVVQRQQQYAQTPHVATHPEVERCRQDGGRCVYAEAFAHSGLRVGDNVGVIHLRRHAHRRAIDRRVSCGKRSGGNLPFQTVVRHAEVDNPHTVLISLDNLRLLLTVKMVHVLVTTRSARLVSLTSHHTASDSDTPPRSDTDSPSPACLCSPQTPSETTATRTAHSPARRAVCSVPRADGCIPCSA